MTLVEALQIVINGFAFTLEEPEASRIVEEHIATLRRREARRAKLQAQQTTAQGQMNTEPTFEPGWNRRLNAQLKHRRVEIGDDPEHEPDCPAIDGFGCRCGESNV